MLVVGKGVVEWVSSKTNEFGNFGTDIGIGWQKDGQLVWGVAYANWNGANIEAHIASDGKKPFMPREYLWTIFDYPFNQLKCKRITTCVSEANKDSQNLTQRLGFELEAKLKDAHPSGYLLIYRMFRNDCRWLNENLYKMRLRLAA